jgi:ABC-2 type transport system permease protein
VATDVAALHPNRVRRPARLRSVFEKALRDERRGLIGWTIGMVVFGAYLLAVFPTIHGNADMKKLLESYPEAMRKMFSLRDFTTGSGFLQTEMFSFLVPLLLMLVAVLWGSDATSGEEDRRTIDLLLANPVERWRVVTEKFAALAVGLAVITIALFVAVLVGGAAVGLGVAIARLVAAVLAAYLFALAFGALALAIGAATGRRGLARGISAAVGVASYLVSGLAGLASWLRPVRPASLFYQTLGREPLFTGFAPLRSLVVAGVTVVFVAAAAWAFERRDLAV